MLIDNETGNSVNFGDFESITAVLNGIDVTDLLMGSGTSRSFTPQESGGLQIDGWVTVNGQTVYAMQTYVTVE
ncbi:hypothetical protein D3P06_17545 [Paracoccus aestuarii]|uniref:Uncharacterized protein n=1 Tax=Paracoccus aestuarii TaxID=453842 RepID=A0A418ZPN1_9RHOB|nr:hypothetical protein [Paracoccus aestuarii]RJK96613.1 hypothetical protein D3P06_17545 [Paracoccus aestuarii]WCR00096.1 hypothetical protein JHW48_05170 [Paracoccus aestuarii]